MGQAEMDKLRQQLHLRHEGQVRIIFDEPYALLTFECSTCLEKMDWDASRGWWNCPDCGYEVTVSEAQEIALKLTQAVKYLNTDVRRKSGTGGFGRWVLEKLFGRRNRLPP